MNNPTTVDTVVQEILGDMSNKEKNTVWFTKEADLIQYLHNWGRQIRNKYNLWEDTALVAATGKDHPDDASMVIIRKVWESLKETEPVLDAECPNMMRVYPLTHWHTRRHPPVCEECGLPYFLDSLETHWIHLFKYDGEWVGLDW